MRLTAALVGAIMILFRYRRIQFVRTRKHGIDKVTVNIAILYTHSIGNQPLNTMVVFKMRDSVPSTRYSRVCNVLRQWNIPFIPTYRVYRLYDTYICTSKQ